MASVMTQDHAATHRANCAGTATFRSIFPHFGQTLASPETRPTLVPQEERGNASLLARRSHLHRKVRIS